jgi:hypothetical protein
MPASRMRLYQVVGRKAPTATDENPPAYRMKLFAPNEIMAKSRLDLCSTRINTLLNSDTNKHTQYFEISCLVMFNIHIDSGILCIKCVR